jgi:ethanolaminephosphotransferase
MRNARQIRDIVLAAFGQEIFETDSDADALTESKADYQELAHGWKVLADSYGRSRGNEDRAMLIPSITKVGVRHDAP